MRIPSLSRDAAYLIAALALPLMTAGVMAQPVPGSSAPQTPSGPMIVAPQPDADRVGTGVVDCTRAANKNKADCSQDNVGNRGISRTASADSFPKDAPRGNDGLSGPASRSAAN
jgi:hypothetical protein